MELTFNNQTTKEPGHTHESTNVSQKVIKSSTDFQSPKEEEIIFISKNIEEFSGAKLYSWKVESLVENESLEVKISSIIRNKIRMKISQVDKDIRRELAHATYHKTLYVVQSNAFDSEKGLIRLYLDSWCSNLCWTTLQIRNKDSLWDSTILYKITTNHSTT